MHPVAARFGNRLGHKGQDHALCQGHFACHLAEENNVIHSLKCIIKRQCVFKLRAIIFGGDHIKVETNRFSHVPDRIVKTTRVSKRASSINDTTKTVVWHKLAVSVVNECKGLKFNPDLGRQPLSLPSGDRTLQRAARAHWQGCAIGVVKIAEHNLRAAFPTFSDFAFKPPQLHIREAFHHHGARRWQQIFVVMDAKCRPTKPRFVVADFGMWKVLSTHDAKVIAKNRAQSVFHVLLLLGTCDAHRQ